MKKLTNSQQTALDALKGKGNVFLTGPAGTGKSFLINHYIREYNPKIPVVCSTGAAAVLVGGRTFHSFFGLGTLQENHELILATALSNANLVSRIMKAKEIIIDEISMLPGRALDLANLICKTIRNKEDLPFGGIRIIAVGDFYQLPPVKTDYKKKVEWAFNSFTWAECEFKCFELKEFMRSTDLDFLSFLSHIRAGRCGPEEMKFLNNHMHKRAENFVGTRIFSRKKLVQDYNQESLDKLTGKEIVFTTKYDGEDKAIERLKRNLPIEEEIKVKIGAFVMIRTNDNSKDLAYVNGTLGHIQEVLYSEIVIKGLDGRLIPLSKKTFILKDGEGNEIAEATNFPISLAYAITIHKSQGASIENGVVDLFNLWDSGQGYTALSRLTSPAGLRILKWNQRSIFVDKEVVSFYKKISSNN
jgi:ATP-dependent DNA helicase PIF1